MVYGLGTSGTVQLAFDSRGQGLKFNPVGMGLN